MSIVLFGHILDILILKKKIQIGLKLKIKNYFLEYCIFDLASLTTLFIGFR